jgi:hypothetical protein
VSSADGQVNVMRSLVSGMSAPRKLGVTRKTAGSPKFSTPPEVGVMVSLTGVGGSSPRFSPA